MVDPFEPFVDLVCISSAMVARRDVKNDIPNAHEVGECLQEHFVNFRFLTTDVDFYSVLKNQKLKTFTSHVKTTSQVKSSKEIVLRSVRTLFARLLIISQTRQLDVREVLSYCYEFWSAWRAIGRSTPMATESPTGRTIRTQPFWNYRQKSAAGRRRTRTVYTVRSGTEITERMLSPAWTDRLITWVLLTRYEPLT